MGDQRRYFRAVPQDYVARPDLFILIRKKTMKGFHKRILNVDLSKREFWTEQIPDNKIKFIK